MGSAASYLPRDVFRALVQRGVVSSSAKGERARAVRGSEARVFSARCCGTLDPERLGKARQLIRARIIRDGAAWCSDVLRSGLRSRVLPLRTNFFRRKFAIVDLVNATKYRLRILLTNLRDGNATRLHRVLKNRRIEIRKLFEVRPFQIMQMEHSQLRVSERIENSLVIGTGVLFIVFDRAEFALRVENARERARRPNFLTVSDVIDC